MRFIFYLTFFLLFPVVTSSSVLRGQAIYELNHKSKVHRLDRYISVFIDSTDQLTIDQISEENFRNRFTPTDGNLTFGYLKSTIWLRTEIFSGTPEAEWLLEIPAPFLEYVDFYQLTADGIWKQSQAGYYRKQSVREIQHTGHVVRLNFNEDGKSIVYIRVAGRSPKTFTVLATEQQMFHEKVRFEDVGYGLFFGIIVVMFCFNFMLSINLKQPNYLLYSFTIACTFFIFASASGYGGRFLWPETPYMNFLAGRMSLGLMIAVLSIFTIRFLKVRVYSKVMYYTLLSLIPLAVIATILVATGVLSSAGNNLISISTIVFMTTGIVCSFQGNKTANYYIAAWGIYLLGGLLLTLRNSGVLDSNFWTTHFVEIGAALETIIIAFALSDQYRRLRKEKEAAQLQALKLQLGANEKLERKVQERTEQLSKTNEELRSTLETNTLQTRIIEQKNAELDSFFVRISHDLKGPISSLLGLSSLAKMDVQDATALEYFERQHQQAQRLSSVVTGLINLAKLNHTELSKEKIDFRRIVDDCILSFNGLPNFKNITFKKEIQESIQFYSEWTLVNAILQNLIENAIKYSGNKNPFVHINITDQNNVAEIEVADNGLGIPEDHQSKIFEMFYRATDNATGTGLGLYILKRSVDRLNGSIELKSEPGSGSVFTVRLPSLQ